MQVRLWGGGGGDMCIYIEFLKSQSPITFVYINKLLLHRPSYRYTELKNLRYISFDNCFHLKYHKHKSSNINEKNTQHRPLKLLKGQYHQSSAIAKHRKTSYLNKYKKELQQQYEKVVRIYICSHQSRVKAQAKQK